MKHTGQDSFRQARTASDAVTNKALPNTSDEVWQPPVLVRLVPNTAAFERARAAFALKT